MTIIGDIVSTVFLFHLRSKSKSRIGKMGNDGHHRMSMMPVSVYLSLALSEKADMPLECYSLLSAYGSNITTIQLNSVASKHLSNAS
jgi:hypothetical protein